MILPSVVKSNCRQKLTTCPNDQGPDPNEGGCADYLWIPEPTKCSGPDVAVLHTARGMLLRHLNRYDEYRSVLAHAYQRRTQRSQDKTYIIIIQRVPTPMLKAPRVVLNHNQLESMLRKAMAGKHSVSARSYGGVGSRVL